MKPSLLKSILALGLSAGVTAQAGIYTYTGSPYDIPDGSRAGTFSQITVSGEPISLTDITVTLDVSGGYNGDLYAYLSYNGTLVPLLNRVGVSSGDAFGSADSGLSVTLVTSGSQNVHAASAGDDGTPLTGTYVADGQKLNPLASASSFSPSGGPITLDGAFGDMNPNGTWTLFLADVSVGGGQATLNDWNLTIAAVPEPGDTALWLFAGVILAGYGCWRGRAQQLFRR